MANSTSETSQNVDLVFEDEDEMPLNESLMRKLTQTFIKLTPRLKKAMKMKATTLSYICQFAELIFFLQGNCLFPTPAMKFVIQT